MLYLLGMSLVGSATGGAILGKIINVFFALFTALVIYAFVRRFFTSGLAGLAKAGRAHKAALVGASVFLISPWVLGLAALRAYVEMGLAFYSILALYSFFHFLDSGNEIYAKTEESRRTGSSPTQSGPHGLRFEQSRHAFNFPDTAHGKDKTRWLVISGIFTGIAMGYKYPAALFLALPLVLGMFFFSLRRGAKRAVFRAVLFLAVALLIFSPWLIKNFCYTGNPTYPLLYEVFGSSEWDGERDARWAKAHSPGGFGLPDSRNKAKILGQRIMEGTISPALLIFIPFAFFIPQLRKRGLVLLGLIGYSLVVWFCFTHRIERFLFPVLPVAAVLSGPGYERLETHGRGLVAKVILLGLLLLALFAAFQVYPVGGLGVRIKDDEAVARWFDEVFTQNPQWNYPAPAINYINKELPQGSKVLLVGEAAHFYIKRKFISSTVFDEKLLEQMLRQSLRPQEIAARLARLGVTHIFCNWPEVARLNSTYSYEFGGKKFPGYSAYITPEVFDDMEASGVIATIAAFGTPDEARALNKEETDRGPYDQGPFVLYKLLEPE
jgi:4-amino-4-deoxy-L-arabinose transferase-like glycosyltransferase